MRTGLIINAISALLTAVLFYFGMVTVTILILCGFILMFGNCLIVGSGASIATLTSSDKANASAVMNFINVGMVMLGTFILAITPGLPLFKLPALFFLAILLMSLVWLFLIDKKPIIGETK